MSIWFNIKCKFSSNLKWQYFHLKKSNQETRPYIFTLFLKTSHTLIFIILVIAAGKKKKWNHISWRWPWKSVRYLVLPGGTPDRKQSSASCLSTHMEKAGFIKLCPSHGTFFFFPSLSLSNLYPLSDSTFYSERHHYYKNACLLRHPLRNLF